MTDLIDTTEMYLKTVFELLELGITPMRARIAERLHQSGPTVSQTVARMERDGLLFLDDERVIHLSIEGERIATSVMRKHRLAERHLIDVIGLEYSKVHEEACRWEHVMSEEVERRLVAVLDNPTRSPFGNPIPALDALGATEEEAEESGTRATDLRLTEPAQARVVQISEILQVPLDSGKTFAGIGHLVGETVTLTPLEDGALEISTANRETAVLPAEVAHALRVEPEK